MNGGSIIARRLKSHGVKHIFTVCGGHISPVLVEAENYGLRVIDVRHEATAAFAADAMGRLSGVPGVAVVTAGPGVTNTITALKNCQLAQTPMVLFGGATATMLKGKGSLQDIDQLALMQSCTKWSVRVERLQDLDEVVDEAFVTAQTGVCGPVFVEVPIDILYDRDVVEKWYFAALKKQKNASMLDKAQYWYIKRHLQQLLNHDEVEYEGMIEKLEKAASPPSLLVKTIAKQVGKSDNPVLLIGSQTVADPAQIPALQAALETLNMPIYLSGMARGLLGANHPFVLRHKRKQALREADCVVVAGMPLDFRLDYGSHINRKAKLILVNRAINTTVKNKIPNVPVPFDPAKTLIALAEEQSDSYGRYALWLATLRNRDNARNQEIAEQAQKGYEHINPMQLFYKLDQACEQDAVFVADGGDFVATASYILNPDAALHWLDPGVFGTLGVGAGFAIAAALHYPNSQVWLLWGDGASGYGLAEFDTFVRHKLPIIGVLGNDASWSQIAREQLEIFENPVGTNLQHSDYHTVAKGFGAAGFRLESDAAIKRAFSQAIRESKTGKPVLLNAIISKTDFRKGSISM